MPIGEIFAASITALASAGVGLLMYFTSKRRQAADEKVQSDRLRREHSSALFDDARDLSQDYIQAYAIVKEQLDLLTKEMEIVQEELKSLKFWKGVAYEVATEFVTVAGVAPKAWPPTEPLPEVS